MALIGIGGPKGSPGATSTAVLLGSWWPSPVVLLEADPDGGVLAIRYGLRGQPGLLELTGHGRNRRLSDFGSLLGYAQRTGEGAVPMVVAPDHPDTVANALGSEGQALGEWCAELDGGDIIVDLGRISPTSPVWSLASQCDLVLVCASPTADQLQPAAARAARLRSVGVACSLVLIGNGPYGPGDVESAYGLKVSAVLPHDPAGAAALSGSVSRRVVKKSPLMREGRRLTDQLVAWAHPADQPEVNVEDTDSFEGAPLEDASAPERRSRFGRNKTVAFALADAIAIEDIDAELPDVVDEEVLVVKRSRFGRKKKTAPTDGTILAIDELEAELADAEEVSQ